MGKSDLALRLIDRGARLVADDYVELHAEDGHVMCKAPEKLFGLIEVRGLGLVRLEALSMQRLDLVVDLIGATGGAPERLPPRQVEVLEGLSLPCLHLRALDTAAPEKTRLALKAVTHDSSVRIETGFTGDSASTPAMNDLTKVDSET